MLKNLTQTTCLVAALMGSSLFGQVAAPGNGIALDDEGIVAWASQMLDFQQGPNVESQFSRPERALGPAEGNVMDIVSLGPGGMITLGFDGGIIDGEGWDFAVFENSFGDLFLELAYVEVSQDGLEWVRFPNESLTKSRVPAFGLLKSEDVSGLAGKYRAGIGTPFDLADLSANIDRVQYVRVIDVIGDGRDTDSHGNPIYDPYPTIGSAGFDLDAVAVRHLGAEPGQRLNATIANGAIVIEWPSQPGTDYDVLASSDGLSWRTEATVPATASTSRVELPLAEGPQFYRVRAQ